MWKIKKKMLGLSKDRLKVFGHPGFRNPHQKEMIHFVKSSR